MAELLLQNIVVCFCCSYSKYFNILLIRTTWQVVLVPTTYSTLAEERVTICCFLDAHDYTCSKMKCVARGTFRVIYVSSKIIVSISNKSKMFWSRIFNAKVFCSIHISQNSFSYLPMGFIWSLHELWNQDHSIHNMKPCCC